MSSDAQRTDDTERTDETRRILRSLLEQRPAGRSLPSAFYADPDIFEQDMERFVMRHWLCAGHVSRAPAVGDFFVIELARESVIIVRGKDERLRAFANVCRHRGSRLCREESGHATALLCPYHAWTYNLDGTLRAARHMSADFDRSHHGLHELPLRVLEGLVFICFSDSPPELRDVEENLTSVCRPYGWANAKIAHREVYPIAANWKLAIENYLECYHCGPSHPEFARVHSNEQPREKIAELTALLEARATSMNLSLKATDRWALLAERGQEATWSLRYSMLGEAVTGSEDGRPVAPLMGQFSDYDGGSTFFHVGPTSFFLAYADHGVIYRFIPRTVQTAELEVCWLVDENAVQGRDYDIDRLTWLWRVTSIADKRIIEENQHGVNSRFYVPGPLSSMESVVARFVDWYASEMAPL